MFNKLLGGSTPHPAQVEYMPPETATPGRYLVMVSGMAYPIMAQFTGTKWLNTHGGEIEPLSLVVSATHNPPLRK